MLDRTLAPPFQKSSTFSLITPERVELPNGIKLTYVNGGEQEVIKVEFIFRAGKWYERMPGVSYFTAHVLQKGTAHQTSYQISNTFDQWGIHIEVNHGSDFTSLALYGLNKHIEKLFELTFEIISTPVFPEAELQQAKDIYIQGLKINLEKTSYLASKQLRENLFGAQHPYGYDASIEAVQAIKRDQLMAYHRSQYGEMDIICSGLITDSIRKSIGEAFGKLNIQKATDQVHTLTGKVPFSQYVEREHAVQTSIRLGKFVIGRSHTDYPALLLLNHIFGGYFGSRLMKNIREDKGLTYGIYSSVTSPRHASYLTIGADVNKENRVITVEEIKKEMHRLRTERIGVNELETARNHFIGSLQSEITTPFAHADKIKSIQLNELPADYYASLIQKIETLTSDDLIRVANAEFDESSFFEVSVG